MNPASQSGFLTNRFWRPFLRSKHSLSASTMMWKPWFQFSFFCFGDFSDGIVAWVKKKTGPAISVVKSSADAEELLKEETTLAVAFLDDFEVDGLLCSIKRI